jgi:hypothetical protein
MSIVGPVGPVEFVDLCRPAKKVRLTTPSIYAQRLRYICRLLRRESENEYTYYFITECNFKPLSDSKYLRPVFNR